MGTYVLEKIEELNEKNYPLWKSRIRFSLMRRELWVAIEDPSKATPAADQKALGEIGQYVPTHYIPIIAAAKTAKEAWDAIEKIYVKSAEMNRVHLWRELSSSGTRS